jgi:hypothetical protein
MIELGLNERTQNGKTSSVARSDAMVGRSVGHAHLRSLSRQKCSFSPFLMRGEDHSWRHHSATADNNSLSCDETGLLGQQK